MSQNADLSPRLVDRLHDAALGTRIVPIPEPVSPALMQRLFDLVDADGRPVVDQASAHSLP